MIQFFSKYDTAEEVFDGFWFVDGVNSNWVFVSCFVKEVTDPTKLRIEQKVRLDGS